MKSLLKLLPGHPGRLRIPGMLAVLLSLLTTPHPGRAAEPIQIGTIPGLRYDLKRFDVKPRSEVELVFNNRDTMLHNLVITKPGTRMAVVNAATAMGAGGAGKHYVPDSADVLWATAVVASGESARLRFTAPSEPGDYPFVCTYPGHGFLMFGTMRVTNNPAAAEPNVAALIEGATVADSQTTAFVKRAFMPAAGPASIAVRLPGGHAYCWDAGACCFRYAWKGGYVESRYRKTEQLLGEVYYRASHEFPFLFGVEHPVAPKQIRFHGYTLNAAGVPEFEYEADGVRFFEQLEVQQDRLVRRFRTDASLPVTLWFRIDPGHAAQLEATGRREGDFFQFSGKDATEFRITISPSPAHAGHPIN